MDYEGSPYRTAFWEGQGRQYEDAVERLALQKLLPSRGRRIAEIGAGYGRLADLYLGYDQIVLFDYSRTQLADAVAKWGTDPRFIFVAGNIYQLSLAKASLDALVMVRVMHHLADVPLALRQLRRTLHLESVAILEYANKRNLKAVARRAVGRQSWSPFDPEPVEFVELNYDFHPAWMEDQFAQADFAVRRRLAVSHLRVPWLKRHIAADKLARVDSWFFGMGGHYPLSPSVFVQATAGNAPAMPPPFPASDNLAELFVCPACAEERTFVLEDAARLSCRNCGKQYAQREGIWDFKDPIV
jgi:SAM-dependent methyltransferase